MDLGLSGRLALVTGASRGIGRAIAAGLAAEGARVILVSRDPGKLQLAAQLVGAEGWVAGNLSKGDEVERLEEEVRRRFGDPEILIANSGGPPAGMAVEMDAAGWSRGCEETLMPAVRLSRAFLPAMRQRGWGRIVHVTSVSVKQPVPNLVLSNAFRAAVTGFARTLATEVAAEGVTVNNVAPGFTDTDRIRELYPDPEALARLTERIPAKRLATPEEVAAAAVFLCGVPAAMITGQTLLVDGGAVGTLW